MRNSAVVRGLVCAGLLVLMGEAVRADQVTPVSDVKTGVVVRLAPTAQSAAVGRLKPGEKAELIGTVPNWHQVRLGSGVEGYVSKRWTRVEGAEKAEEGWTLNAVDVGTGLGLVVEGPDFLLVFDAGSMDDAAGGEKNRMLAFMKRAMPERRVIDHLILSHAHADHLALLPELFPAYEVREVWDSGAENRTCGYREFLAAVSAEPGVRYHTALRNGGSSRAEFPASCGPAVTLEHGTRITDQPVQLGRNASMVVLYADGSKHSSPNENSLVVRLDLGGTRVLLMGDAEAGGRQPPANTPTPKSIEGRLLACCQAELPARILVAGHHGSKTSSRQAFLDAVGATMFVVSSGPKDYQSVVLPDAVVIEELSRRGELWRTDRDDRSCAARQDKVGTAADGKPGGCDNVRVRISADGAVAAKYWP